LKNNALYDFDQDGTTIYRDTPTLTIEENVRIYGGDVLYGEIHEDNTYRWDMNPDFVEDIHRIWNVSKGNVRYWNKQISVLEAAEKVGRISDDGLTTTASIAAIDYQLSQYRSKYMKAKGIIDYLVKNGLIIYFDDMDDTTLTITYKNLQVKKCLTKAGQALEMKIYAVAREILDEDGVPVYDDALNGVVIDWDGKFHDEQVEDSYDTENEIDVLLMHDVVPVFISCKNGVVTSDELYKLNAVAERFGGQYAKKVLVATALDTLGEAGKYLRQRAKDMNIRIEENIQALDDQELARKIKSFWSN
jgi:hypothetical protein